MVNREQIEKGVASFLDKEFLPKVHMEPWKQFAVATGASIAVKRIGKVMDELKENKAMNMLGIVDGSGNIDIDILAEEAKSKMPPDGIRVPIPIIGEVTLYAADVDTLYRLIIGG